MRDAHHKKGSALFYTFWIIVLLLAIFITILILSTVFPNFRFSFMQLREFAKKSDNATATHTTKTDLEEFGNTKNEDVFISEEAQIHHNISQNKSSNTTENEKKLQLQDITTNPDDTLEIMLTDEEKDTKPIFHNARFTPSSRFLARNGTRFLAGSIEIDSQFPDDFQEEASSMTVMNTLASFPVRTSIDIGWEQLLSFAAIDKILQNSAKRALLPPVEIPPLKILDIRISVSSNAVAEDKHYARDIAKIVKKTIQAFFESNGFSANILSDAQQALAVTYVSHGYKNIVLFSQKE